MNMIKSMMKSKKFVAMLTGAAVWLLATLKVDVEPERISQIVGLISAYILGVGLTDIGKERERIAVEALKEVHSVVEKKPVTS